MVRISDSRMSGTSYGTCVLHVAPESAVGGPLALVQDGDLITLDVATRTLTLEVSEAELAERRGAWVPPEPRYVRGMGRLNEREVTQANEGCDWRILEGAQRTPEPEIH
jgi:dihydroxy-acid dehydratase